MPYQLRRAAVIGAGTMGGGIAALLASCGLPVVLLDVPPAELTPEEAAKGLTLQSRPVRNRIVTQLWERQVKARPSALYSAEAARLVTLGNTEDDLELLTDADWIVEVIVEQPGPKQALFARLEAVRRPDAIVSSNTSGIPIQTLAEGRSAPFRRHFLGTHFFNPPRFMQLLELIPGPETAPEVVAFLRQAAARLGKTPVLCKDRPNFIANRIGVYMMLVRTHYALERGYSVEEVDTLTGPLIGSPKTATFRLTDLVGLDVMLHVTRNLHDLLPDDEDRAVFRVPEALQRMAEAGRLGNKTGAGFYKAVKGAGGEREFQPLNLATDEYEPPRRPRFDLYARAIKIADLGERLRAIFAAEETDRAANYLVETTLPVLAYSARRIPEISDSPADVDTAMRLGYNMELGPFEMWDALGVAATLEKMKARGLSAPAWVEKMLAQGCASFYRREGGRAVAVYQPGCDGYAPLERPANVIVLKELSGTPRELKRNGSASLLDLGDGVLGLEFHSQANTLDHDLVQMGYAAMAALDQPEWAGLVVGNQGENFSLGANLKLVALSVQAGQFGQLEALVRQFQDLTLLMRYSPKPVVTAPFGRTLGGGAETALAGARMVAAAETYLGLVEFGVGLIPAGGGCKELLRRLVAPHVADGAYLLPHLQRAFETIGFAKVSESAHHARELGFLAAGDRIVLNPAELIGEAKGEVLQLAKAGYAPPAREGVVYALGQRGKAALTAGIHNLRWGNYISDYDQHLALKLAHVLSGGDLSAPAWVPERYILDLEREAFLSLLGEPRTQARIAHMLQTGKPLRN